MQVHASMMEEHDVHNLCVQAEGQLCGVNPLLSWVLWIKLRPWACAASAFTH